MIANIARLSAFPSFLRTPNLWGGAFDSRALLNPNTPNRNLLFMTGSHRWDVQVAGATTEITPEQRAVIDIAQGLLERGAWSVPSWRVEQALAERFNIELGWELAKTATSNGNLEYAPMRSAPTDSAFQNALVTGRWKCEAADYDAMNIWESVPSGFSGSEAERHFFLEVLVPVLGFPLLDFLRLQPIFGELGVNSVSFLKQRVDFSLDTGRGVRLVIEIDGYQHEEIDESAHDEERDKALRDAGWDVWRIPTDGLANKGALQDELKSRISGNNQSEGWGLAQKITEPRSRTLLSCVWGATVVARIQFLILEALRKGVLPWDEFWRIGFVERDTDVAELALEDIRDWFGRLRRLHGFADAPEIINDGNAPKLLIDISVIQPHLAPDEKPGGALACSRTAQCDGGQYDRRYGRRLILKTAPDPDLITSFVRDIFRKTSLREGQFEIISHILTGKDVVGLLPTGAGKSLTYQLSGLLLGGLTIYVSPLRSLIQDQYERLGEMGISVASMLMSGIEHRDEVQGIHAPGARFLLLTPERFLIASFRDDLSEYRAMRGDIAQIVIDECHCVSEWGHEFRPAYLSLSRIARDRTRRLGVSAPLVALTGTASSIVLSDVMRELGINASDAVVRARRLDRPEIEIICFSTEQKAKGKRISKLTSDFYQLPSELRDGLLIFCPFVGGGDGVMGAAAAISEVLPDNAYRFYTGQAPEWNKYAAVKLRRRATSLSQEEIDSCKPSWANDDKSWNEQKELWQREYISGTKHSFKVMIATKAFGMGIDKPSIRQVIHWMAPPSPEAYYQEIGRACRDGRNGKAIMLFSDEDSIITNRILDPRASLDDARSAYQEFQQKGGKFSGGDFIRTFFFHDKTFVGPEGDIKALTQTITQIRESVGKGERVVIKFGGDEENLSSEYAIIRLILLGVIEDYTKDYRLHTLEPSLKEDWLAVRDNPHELARHYARHFREYAQRYQISSRIDGEEAILNGVTTEEVEHAAIKSIVNYVYSQIERKRRQASRQMLELARTGVNDTDALRRDLLLYLQVSEKFTAVLERLARQATASGWEKLTDEISQRDDLRELHGACQRVLESYPNHPALLFLSAVSRVDPTADGIDRGVEEFEAALQYGEDSVGLEDTKCGAAFAVRFSGELDDTLSSRIESRFGSWLVDNGFSDDAIQDYARHGAVRTRWLENLSSKLANSFPDLGGL